MNRQMLCVVAAVGVLIIGASPFVFLVIRGGVRGVARIDDQLDKERYDLFQYLVDEGKVRIEEDLDSPDQFRAIVSCDREVRFSDGVAKDEERPYDPEMVFCALQTWFETERNSPAICETKVWIRRTVTYPEAVAIRARDLDNIREQGGPYADAEITVDGREIASTVSATVNGLRPELGVGDCWKTAVSSQEALRFASCQSPLAFCDKFQLEVLFAKTRKAASEH